MKITILSADELELKEGGTAGIVVGIIFVIAGICLWYYMRTNYTMIITA